MKVLFEKYKFKVFGGFSLALFIVFVIALGRAGYYAWCNPEKYLGAVSTSLAIAMSASLAGWYAIRQVDNARKVAKLQETLRLITNAELDREFLAGKVAWGKFKSRADRNREFGRLAALMFLGGGKSTLEVADETNLNELRRQCSEQIFDAILEVNKKEKEAIRKKLKSLRKKVTGATKRAGTIRREGHLVATYLNSFEIVSIAISENIIDAEFYKLWHGTNLVRTWNYSIGFIGAARVLNNNPNLYSQWEKRAKKWAGDQEPTVIEPVRWTMQELVKLQDESGEACG